MLNKYICGFILHFVDIQSYLIHLTNYLCLCSTNIMCDFPIFFFKSLSNYCLTTISCFVMLCCYAVFRYVQCTSMIFDISVLDVLIFLSKVLMGDGPRITLSEGSLNWISCSRMASSDDSAVNAPKISQHGHLTWDFI